MSLPLVEKYRPSKRSDLVGNETGINTIFIFLKKWKRGSSKSGLLLLGPPGSGKTSAVYAIANDLNYEVIEVNASDARNQKSVKQVLGKAAKSVNYFSDKQRVLLMDEVDGLAGNSDRGGLNEFLKIVKMSNYPIICTANDPESDKIEKIQKVLRVIDFQRLDEFDIFELLESLSLKEQINITEEEIEEIVDKCNGDLRAAINDLEAHTKTSIQIAKRDKMHTMTDILNTFYHSQSISETRDILSYAPSNYRFLLYHFFDHTVDQCTTVEEIYESYNQIARADLILSRIMMKQDWSLLKYFFLHLSMGLFISRTNKKFERIDFVSQYPSFLRIIGISKRKNKAISELATYVAPKFHISMNDFKKNHANIFLKIMNSKIGPEIAASLDLKDEAIENIVKLNNDNSFQVNYQKAMKKVTSSRIKSATNIKTEKFILDPYLQKSKQNKNAQKELPLKEETKAEPKTTKKKDAQTSLDDFF